MFAERIQKMFQIVPTSSMPKEILLVLLAFGAALVAGSFAVKFFRKRTTSKFLKKFLRELPTGLLWFGGVCLALVWFRLESVPIFAMRFWWVVFWFSFAVWIFLKIKKARTIARRLNRAMRK